MLKNKIKKIATVVALGALVVFAGVGVKSIMTTNASQDVSEITLDDFLDFDEYDYTDLIDEMLNAGYIDQAKANAFRKGMNLEDVQLEIEKTYELYYVDELVKSGEYSAEVGALEKQLIEADYAENDELYDEIYDKYLDQLEKEGLLTEEDLKTYGTEDMIKEMLDAGYIDQAKADTFTNGMDSQDIQSEIYKTYNLFLIDELVKSGEYSAEVGALEKQLIEADYAQDDQLYNETYEKYWNQLEKEGLLFEGDFEMYGAEDMVKEMLDAGYIDQAKADYFTNSIDSEEVQTEINKMYDLFTVDSFVKEGYCSAEIGELEKQLIEADYANNDALYDEIYEKYLDQLKKEGVAIEDYFE